MNLFGWDIYKKAESKAPPPKDPTILRLRKVCEDLLGFPDGLIFSEDTTREDLWMDSLDSVELLLKVEAEFGIDILLELWERCDTVGEVVILVDLILKEKV